MREAVNRALLQPWAKPLVWLLCGLPLVWLFVRAATNQLGANPAEALIHVTGLWTIRWLWLTLAISPLRDLFGLPGLLRHRRALGVAAFIYGLLHFLAYAWKCSSP